MTCSWMAVELARYRRQVLLEEAAHQRLVREVRRGRPSRRARAASLLRALAERLDEPRPARAEMTGGLA